MQKFFRLEWLISPIFDESLSSVAVIIETKVLNMLNIILYSVAETII